MRNWVTQTMDVYHGTVGQGSIEELADKVARQSRLLDTRRAELIEEHIEHLYSGSSDISIEKLGILQISMCN